MSAAILRSIIAVRQAWNRRLTWETTFSIGVLIDLAKCKLSLKDVGFLYGFHPPSRTSDRNKIFRLIHIMLWISYL